MLLIEQIQEPNNIRSDYVKCPACKRGRLCDKPVGEKAMAIAIQGDTKLLRTPNCPFVLFVGTKKLVKRKEFEQFISGTLILK